MYIYIDDRKGVLYYKVYYYFIHLSYSVKNHSMKKKYGVIYLGLFRPADIDL